jgi:hypothetical protein
MTKPLLQGEHGSWINRTCSKAIRKDSTFVIKQHIETGELKPNSVAIEITNFNEYPETFYGNVWTILIFNKEYRKHVPILNRNISFSGDASESYFNLNVILDKQNLNDVKIPLLWKKHYISSELPSRCTYGGGLQQNDRIREQYKEQLAFRYIGELFKISSSLIDISKGTYRELLLLFTFREYEGAYIINNHSWFPLSFNLEYEFQLKFCSKEYKDSNGKRFRVNIESWDSIVFEEI